MYTCNVRSWIQKFVNDTLNFAQMCGLKEEDLCRVLHYKQMLCVVSGEDMISALLDKWPGKQRFGVYRFMPVFFVVGAVVEYCMINWRVGPVNFC